MERQTTEGMTEQPVVTYRGTSDMQVCVPGSWTDDEVLAFANREVPCGTEHGWQIRKQGDPDLSGSDERVSCSDIAGHVHIMLDA